MPTRKYKKSKRPYKEPSWIGRAYRRAYGRSGARFKISTLLKRLKGARRTERRALRREHT